MNPTTLLLIAAAAGGYYYFTKKRRAAVADGAPPTTMVTYGPTELEGLQVDVRVGDVVEIPVGSGDKPKWVLATNLPTEAVEQVWTTRPGETAGWRFRIVGVPSAVSDVAESAYLHNETPGDGDPDQVSFSIKTRAA